MTEINASIPLSVQTPQIDLAGVLNNALQLRQMQQQDQSANALKAIFSQPGALDPKTGRPTTNALIAATRIDPKIGQALVSENAEAEERQAVVAKDKSETQTYDMRRHAETLSDLIGVYDATLSGGNTDPAIAENVLKSGIKDYIDGQAWGDEQKAKVWGAMSNLNPTQLRQAATHMTMNVAQQASADKVAGERTPMLMNGKTVFVSKEIGPDGRPVVTDADGAPVEVTGPLEKPGTPMDPKRAQLEERRVALAEKVAEGGAADLDDNDMSFAAEMVLNGQPMPNMGYGKAGAEARKKILHRAAQMAAEQSGSAEAGADEAVVRKESLAADKASLTAVTKQQASVRQFSETALGLTNKIEQTMDKGTTKAGPEWLAKVVQNIKTGQLGDPDTREFLGYVTDLESENAKIMAGATGSVAQVSAHNQALMNQIISGGMPASEIKGALKTIRSGIELRNESLDNELKRQKESLRGDTASGGRTKPADGLPEVSTEDAYKKLKKGDRYHYPGDPPGAYRTKNTD